MAAANDLSAAATWVRLQTFMAVYETGSVRVAAEALHVTPPAVSAAVTALESALGTTLFGKAGRGIVPTDAGETFAGYDVVRTDASARRTLAVGAAPGRAVLTRGRPCRRRGARRPPAAGIRPGDQGTAPEPVGPRRPAAGRPADDDLAADRPRLGHARHDAVAAQRAGGSAAAAHPGQGLSNERVLQDFRSR